MKYAISADFMRIKYAATADFMRIIKSQLHQALKTSEATSLWDFKS